MREQLDTWCLYKEAEDNEQRLCRFFIAIDELRARLSSRYPNLEISDEGYLWFNIDTPQGTVEILAFPFGFKNLKQPSIAVSLPRKARETHSNLLKKLHQIAKSISKAETFTGTSPRDETLKAYSQNNQPPLTLSWNANILEIRKEGISYE